MKRFFEDLLSQMLIDLVLTRNYHLIDWLYSMPWQMWFG
jgi:hypothetical protein